jgi:hypothetical protein
MSCLILQDFVLTNGSIFTIIDTSLGNYSSFAITNYSE